MRRHGYTNPKGPSGPWRPFPELGTVGWVKVRTVPALGALGAWISLVLAAGVLSLPDRPDGRDRVVSSAGAAGDSVDGTPRGATASSGTSASSTTATAAPASSTTVGSRPYTARNPAPPLDPSAGPVQTAPGMPRGGPATVSGTIRDAAGRPVAGACVEVFGGGIGFAPRILDTVTGADGHYSATHQLTTESEWPDVRVRDCTGNLHGFAERVVEVHTFPHQSFTVDITVSGPAAVVRGTVVDADGHGVDGAGLCAAVWTGGPDPVYSPTAPDGSFVVTGVPATPMASVQIFEGCDSTAGFIQYAVASVGEVRPGADLAVLVTIPHGARSRA
jgi:protocatechuate 3,4-dioxygenase beta subunit